MESKILQGLNPQQRAAVENYEQPSLIIAGAGSGKTRVLTSRIAYMLEQGVQPHNILALTFTNKAAEQMRTRIEQMVGSRARYIRMGTFHSVFSRILRENAERIGYTDSYTIYEPSDCKNLIKTICKEMNLADDKYKPAKVLSRISFAKNCLVTSGAYAANSVYAAEDRQAQMPHFGDVYAEYCRRCKQNGAMDFDDLLLQTNVLLRDCPDVLHKYQELFHYILVDEYQDTNFAQYIIIRRLSQLHGRVCVVGDDAQSIYSFRGAKIENILSFRNDYPQAQTYKLEQNYRSTRTIVEAANSVIEHNSRRMEKKCFSEGERGDKISIVKSLTPKEEGKLFANLIRDRIRYSSVNFSDIAILYRNNEQAQYFEEAFKLYKIPYVIYKGSSFYQSKEIRDILAYIRLVINPKDDEALKRIINYPTRGIGETTIGRIAQLASEHGQSMWEFIDNLNSNTISSDDTIIKTITRKVGEFVNLIRSLIKIKDEESIYNFGQAIISNTGILKLYNEKKLSNDPDDVKDATTALNNIESLLNGMQDFTEECEAKIRNEERDETDRPSVEEWLQNIMLLTDMDNKEDNTTNDKVTLMTVHSAKGLEYEYIFIAGCEEELFPSERAMESPDGLEEERRLFYVALTRAKAGATLSYCDMRPKWGEMRFRQPSRFLREIDPRYVDCDEDLTVRPPRAAESENEGFSGRMGSFSRGGYGGPKPAAQRTEERRDGRTAIEELRRRFDVRFQKQREQSTQKPDPRIVASVEPRSTEGLKRVVAAPAGASSLGPCPYAVGERVEHPKFGVGVVRRVEMMATDHKVVVDFGTYGEKTLLAKFAKLQKL